MIDSPFSQGKSILHALDPRVKILVISLYSFLIAVERSPAVLLYASFLPLVLFFLSRLRIKEVAKRMLPVNGFILLLWLFLPFSFPGEQVFTLGPLAATREGIFYCLILTWKSNLIFLTTLLLLSTSPIFHLVHALHHLKLPSRLVQLFYFTYRYIPVMHREYTRLSQAAKVRGFQPGNNLHTYRSTGYLIGMLILRAYERSQRIYQAMLARGFQGTFWTLHHFRWRKADGLAGLIFFLYFLGLCYLKWL